jgi:hypothetical protein
MARRRGQTVEHNGDELVLPRHLADQSGLSGSEYGAFYAQRSAWFRARGVDPHDWKQVRPILNASWAAYGIERGALLRRRLLVADPELIEVIVAKARKGNTLI